MQALQTWQRNLRFPRGDRLQTMLAIAAILIFGLGNLLFIVLGIVPRVQARSELALQLDDAEGQLLVALTERMDAPERIEAQIAAAEASLPGAASGLLTEAQAALMLDKLYETASASGAVVSDLQTLPSPANEGDLYVTRSFRLQAVGEFDQLIDFITRIDEPVFSGILLSNVHISEGESGYTLTVDVTLYTSDYAAGQTAGSPPAAPSENLAGLNQALDAALAAEQWQTALALAGQLLALDPAQPGLDASFYAAYTGYGYQLLAEGDSSAAATQFSLALAVNPAGEEALAGLQQAGSAPAVELEQALQTAWTAQNWPEAIRLVEQALQQTPADPSMTANLYAARVNYGNQHLAQDDPTAAAAQFNLALAIKPDGQEALAGLAQTGIAPVPPPASQIDLEQQLPIAWAAQDWPQVISLIEQLLAINPGDSSMTANLYAAQVNYGVALAAAGQPQEAKAAFVRALDIQPDGPEALAGLQSLSPSPPPSSAPTATPTPLPTATPGLPQPTPTVIAPTVTPPAVTFHLVVRGDTLYSIARRYNTTVDAIKAANGLTSDTIYAGQTLRIPN